MKKRLAALPGADSQRRREGVRERGGRAEGLGKAKKGGMRRRGRRRKRDCFRSSILSGCDFVILGPYFKTLRHKGMLMT